MLNFPSFACREECQTARTYFTARLKMVAPLPNPFPPPDFEHHPSPPCRRRASEFLLSRIYASVQDRLHHLNHGQLPILKLHPVQILQASEPDHAETKEQCHPRPLPEVGWRPRGFSSQRRSNARRGRRGLRRGGCSEIAAVLALLEERERKRP